MGIKYSWVETRMPKNIARQYMNYFADKNKRKLQTGASQNGQEA